jgi:hypothetical protein
MPGTDDWDRFSVILGFSLLHVECEAAAVAVADDG